MTIGDTIRLARIRRGWTKTKLASAIGVTPAVVGRVERGENNNPVTLKNIADVLGLSMQKLIR